MSIKHIAGALSLSLALGVAAWSRRCSRASPTRW